MRTKPSITKGVVYCMSPLWLFFSIEDKSGFALRILQTARKNCEDEQIENCNNIVSYRLIWTIYRTTYPVLVIEQGYY